MSGRPIEAYEAILTLDVVRRMIETIGRDTARAEFSELLSGPVRAAMSAFLRAKSLAGELSPVAGVDGHQIDLANCWNGLARGEMGADWSPEHNLRRIADLYGRVMTFTPVWDAARKIEKEGVELGDLAPQVRSEIIAMVEKGDARWWMTGGDTAYCAVDGGRYASDLIGWSLAIGKTGKGDAIDPIKPIDPPLYEVVEFDVGSGDLLIADWFRIEGIHDLFNPEFEKEDINCSNGKRDMTMRYLKDYGFLSVCVGNSSPGVFLDGDQIVIGNTGYDREADEEVEETGVVEKGRICTDLWWVTIFPREKLLEHAAKVVGAAKAEAAVAAAIEEHHGSCVNIKVEPGVRQVYFSGDRHRFVEEFHSPELSVSGHFTPNVVIATRPLTIEEKPAPAAAPGL